MRAGQPLERFVQNGDDASLLFLLIRNEDFNFMD